MEKINYAFSKDYISNWGINEALREIFQNYIDYGHYDVVVNSYENSNNLLIHISNDYKPNNLEFLRLGNSTKTNFDKIGHHGEGLKAAFLIFGREDLYFKVFSNKYCLSPGFDDTVIGETLYISYEDNNSDDERFVTEFNCPKDIYENFINKLITKDDVLFTHFIYGDLLKSSRTPGDIYCGGLFVCNIKNLQRAYNIKPYKLNLDRDRCVPNDFDLDYATSQILTDYKRSEDTTTPYVPISFNSREYNYSSYVTENDIKRIDAIKVKDGIQFYDNVNKEVITNTRIKNALNNHSKFNKIKKLSYKSQLKVKTLDAKRKKTITLIKDFKKNYCNNNIDMSIDVDIIIKRITDNK